MQKTYHTQCHAVEMAMDTYKHMHIVAEPGMITHGFVTDIRAWTCCWGLLKPTSGD